LGFEVMSITIQIPAPLRSYCQGAATLSVLAAASVRAVLEQIERSHPSLHRSVCDETGAVRRHVNLFVNSQNVRDMQGVDTALVSGDILTILPAVSGG
jgi:molybdopterin converting factor small subunit